MPRVHTVKKARKANKAAGIKKGDTYYWWKFRRGGKCVSKTYPKPSQLTRSDFWSAVYSLQEEHENVPEFDELESTIDVIKNSLEEIKDETQGKFDNMPEGLQQGDTGQLLEERVQALDDVISDLDSLSVPTEEDVKNELPEKEEDDDRDDEERLDEAKGEKAREFWGEVTDALSNISCS